MMEETHRTPDNEGNHPRARRQLSPGQAISVVLVGVFIIAALAIPYTDWWREGKYGKSSLTELQQLYPSHGGDPILLYWLGKRLNEKRDYQQAAQILEPAVKMEPGSARLRDAWAEAQLATGQAGPAFSQLKQFVMTNPTDPQAHLLLGKLHVTLGADVMAEPELKEAARLNPSLPEAWALLGDVYYRNAREDEAVTALRRAITLSPNHASSYDTLGKILTKKDANGATDAFRHAVEAEPTNAAYHRDYADILRQQGHFADAEKEAREALRLDANDAPAYLILGRCLRERNELAEAQTALEKAAALEPFDPIPARELQAIFHRQGKKAEESEWARQYTERLTIAAEGRRLSDALLRSPMDHEAHRQMARYQAKLGKIEDCVHHLAIALSEPLDSPAVLNAAVRELRAVGRENEAAALEKQMLAPGRSPVSP